MKEEAKWDLLDHIQKNSEGWENDKGRKLGINYDYKCIKFFMGTGDFHNISAVYGLDSQILANCFKAFVIFHIKLSTPRLACFICSSLILQGSWSDHCNLKKEKEKKRKRHSSMVCESWWAPDGIG
jgi:hypothetical protein